MCMNFKCCNPLSGIGGAFVVQKGKTTEIFANALEEPVPLGSKLRRMKYFYVDEDPAPGTGVGTFVSAKTVRLKNLILI